MHHTMVSVTELIQQAAAFATKLRVQLLRDFGPCLDPDSAFNFLQGLETLHLRVTRHNENAIKVAEFLKTTSIC